MSELPLVSVVIPAYNAEDFIAETLNSVISQTYKNIEVLVVDDGSKDKTPQIVQSLAQKDSRIILLQQKNAGVAAARNLGIQTSHGEYIAPVDADDIWYPEKLEKQVECMLNSDNSVGLIYCWSVNINEKSEILHFKGKKDCNPYSVEGKVYLPLLYLNFLGNGSVPLIRRSCFEKVGGYNCQLREQNAQGCEDWDLYLRIAQSYEFKLVPDFLMGYRQVTGSMGRNCFSMGRSYELVMAEVQSKLPTLPKKIYSWSGGYFYSYLVGQSCSGNDPIPTLFCIYRGILFDWALMLRPGLYRLFLSCCFRLVVITLTGINYTDAQQKITSKSQITTLEDIRTNIQAFLNPTWKPYDQIIFHRWNQILEANQTLCLPELDTFSATPM
jgi:glycosyltransferase involved in cell wall biosynthesis